VDDRRKKERKKERKKGRKKDTWSLSQQTGGDFSSEF
jgi:hypothetical protein